MIRCRRWLPFIKLCLRCGKDIEATDPARCLAHIQFNEPLPFFFFCLTMWVRGERDAVRMVMKFDDVGFWWPYYAQ